MTQIEFITSADLDRFKKELLEELKLTLSPTVVADRPWLRSADVRRMLNISANTLQSFRIKGIIASTKVGGIWFYKRLDIIKVLENS
jgi:hypothetical protein